jgi:hypothetical protein
MQKFWTRCPRLINFQGKTWYDLLVGKVFECNSLQERNEAERVRGRDPGGELSSEARIKTSSRSLHRKKSESTPLTVSRFRVLKKVSREDGQPLVHPAGKIKTRT